jgi:hypothetical protein
VQYAGATARDELRKLNEDLLTATRSLAANSTLRRLVAEPEGSIIQGYDENLWATAPQLGYESAPVENSIAVFAAVRASSLDIIKRLNESDLEKAGEHSESGRFTIGMWLAGYTNHPKDHGDQLVRAVKGQI